MSKDQIQTGQAQECWNVSETRVLKYTLEMYHKGLKEHKLISAPELDILENKVKLQAQKWTDKWERIELKRRINSEKEANIEEANSRTKAAIKSLTEILHPPQTEIAVGTAGTEGSPKVYLWDIEGSFQVNQVQWATFAHNSRAKPPAMLGRMAKAML